jgi:hypothetical protein
MDPENAVSGNDERNGDAHPPERGPDIGSDGRARPRRRAGKARRGNQQRNGREGVSVGDGPPLVDPSSTFDVLRRAVQELKKPLGDPDDPAWKTHLAVMDALCRREYDGITSRDPGSIDIRCTEKGFAVSVSDFGLGTKLTAYSAHLLDALDTLQLAFEGKVACVAGKLKRGKGADKMKADEKKAVEARAQKR